MFIYPLINIILDYDGRIKYKKGKYVNVIHKNDSRYNIIKIVIAEKKKIIEKIELSFSCYYFHFDFIINNKVGLFYDVNKFEICYYNKNSEWEINSFFD